MDNLIYKMQPFMFTTSNLSTFSEIKEEEKEHSTSVQKEETSQKPGNLFIPKYKDTLFWCFYIITKGWENFYLIGQRSFSVEKDYKISCIELLRKKKELLKKHRWKKTQIEDDLLNQRTISTPTFLCLCALYDINITIIEDYYYYTHMISPNTPFFYIKKYNNQYGIYTEKSHHIKTELANSWKITNMKKPLKGISSYKVGELKKICKSINISMIDKNRRMCNKQEIYKLIQSKIE